MGRAGQWRIPGAISQDNETVICGWKLRKRLSRDFQGHSILPLLRLNLISNASCSFQRGYGLHRAMSDCSICFGTLAWNILEPSVEATSGPVRLHKACLFHAYDYFLFWDDSECFYDRLIKIAGTQGSTERASGQPPADGDVLLSPDGALIFSLARSTGPGSAWSCPPAS